MGKKKKALRGLFLFAYSNIVQVHNTIPISQHNPFKEIEMAKDLEQRVTEAAERSGIPVEEMVITSGAALYLLAVRNTFGDVDISVNLANWNKISGRFPIDCTKRVPIIRFVDLDVDIHLDSDSANGWTRTIDGLTIAHPKLLLEQKRQLMKRLNRAKDEQDVAALEQYIRGHQL